MAFRFIKTHAKLCNLLKFNGHTLRIWQSDNVLLFSPRDVQRQLGDIREFSWNGSGAQTSATDDFRTSAKDETGIKQKINDVPYAVRKMRQSLSELHGLSQGSSDLPQPKNHENAEDLTIDPEFEEKQKHDRQEELTAVHCKTMHKKFPFIQRSDTPKNYEKVMETSYGLVRMDSKPSRQKVENMSNVTEYQAPNVEDSSGYKDSDSNYFDEAYFSSQVDTKMGCSNVQPYDTARIENARVISEVTEGKDFRKIPADELNESDAVENVADENIFDEQYFDGATRRPSNPQLMDVENETTEDNLQHGYSHRTEVLYDSNIFDQQYFSNTERTAEIKAQSEHAKYTDSDCTDSMPGKLPEVTYYQQPEVISKEVDKQYKLGKSTQGPMTTTAVNMSNIQTGESMTTDIHIETVTRQEKRQTSRVRANIENPQSAYDAAIKIRQKPKNKKQQHKKKSTENQKEITQTPKEAKWTGQTDSHGYKILKNQVLDIRNMPISVVVSILKDSILYEDENLIAIDKPYGLPSHGGPGVHHSVGQLLVPLAERLGRTELDLQLVHRLDKETTGVMLIAKNPQSQHVLRTMFKKRQVLKKYWVLTKGIPSPTQGCIDIPMTEGTVGLKHRMTLSPRYSATDKLMLKTAVARNRSASDAITNYKVLDSNHSCALVECQPETGVKHQLRCHLSFALNTPILGDHKYSHYSKLAPQKLYPEILMRLGIRQAKVRHLPMHLHAVQLVLPEFKDGRNLFISARLPKHFAQNMKWLKIKVP